MEIHGNFEVLEEFEHRGRKVEIIMADQGAEHCGVQHEYDEMNCKGCGAQIRPDKVLLIYIDESDLGVRFVNLDLGDAVEFAKQFIDDLDDEGDPTSESPPTTGGQRKRRQKKDPNSVLTPPNDGNPGSSANLLETIEKLKWAGEGLRIIREVGKS